MTRSVVGNLPVFVFGTLKQGFPNFHCNAGSRLPGHFRLVNRYPLYLVGVRQSPWLVDNPGHGFRVRGQLFDVDSNALDEMDTLERTGDADGYRRRVTRVSDNDQEISDVFVYLKPLAQYAEVVSRGETVTGPYADYTPNMADAYQPRPAVRILQAQDN